VSELTTKRRILPQPGRPNQGLLFTCNGCGSFPDGLATIEVRLELQRQQWQVTKTTNIKEYTRRSSVYLGLTLTTMTYRIEYTHCSIVLVNPSYHITHTTQTERRAQESPGRQRRQRVARRPKVASREKTRLRYQEVLLLEQKEHNKCQ